MVNLKKIPSRRGRMAKYVEIQARKKVKAVSAADAKAKLPTLPPEKLTTEDLKDLFYI